MTELGSKISALAADSPQQYRERWTYLDRVLSRPGPFSDPDWVAGEPAISALESAKVLVIGAGGLGCEILKNLALSGFKDIHVIDMDTIDVSNLNRQFLFREADVGKSKAEVAAAFIERRVKGVKITPYNGKIQDKDEDYYMQFNIVVCGLDSIEARRWINAMFVDMVDSGDESTFKTFKPMIDGGTEGFKGHARVIMPTIGPCIECQLDMHAPRAAVPLCTIATIPRQPQHCIEWAHLIAWPEHRKDEVLDNDDPEHITWLYEQALARAEEFKITGVTYSLTQGVVKNIIPAIASTNAIIAASCCNEALKIITECNPFLNNYMMYTGDDGIYTYTFEVEKKDDCPVCGNLARELAVDPKVTLEDFIKSLGERPDAQLKKPSLSTDAASLYFQSPASLEMQTRPNLKRKLNELVSDGEELAVSDPAFQLTFRFKLRFTEE